VNENLRASPNAISLLTEYEKGPDDGSVPLSPGGAALAPYVCPGGELTIGYGCTKWFDGDDVQMSHRLEGEDQARALLHLQLKPFETTVREALTREANQNQFDGMLCLAFNIGPAAFLGSSVLSSFNEGRMEDAAANFGKWTGATCDRPPKKQRNDPAYQIRIGVDHKGTARWVGPDGQYCHYMLRYRGLLDRHYAEALLFMSRQFRRTLRSEQAMRIELDATHPADAQWNASKGRWEDGVKFKTPFKDVYAAAYDDLLPADELVLTQPAPPLVATTRVPDGKAEQPGAITPSPSSSAASAPPVSPAPTVSVVPPVVVAKKPEVVASPPAAAPRAPVPPPPRLPDPPVPIGQQTSAVDSARKSEEWSSSPKAMIFSRRAWGLFLVLFGRLWMLKTGSNAVLGTVSDPLVMEMFSGFMVMMVGEIVQWWGEKKAKRPLC
jgi:lysozyme